MFRSFFLFAVSGTIAFVVDYAIVVALTAIGLSPYVARLFSFGAAATTTWAINTRVTFRSERQPLSFRRWCTYMTTMLGGLAANYGAYSLVLYVASKSPAGEIVLLFGVAAGSIAGLVVNYTVCRVWLFRKKA